MLTHVQKAHVDAVFPECKAQMASYLEGGVEVVIGRQTKCGPDVPPIAIAVAADQSFWIDCCDSEKLARARAKELGLRVGARSIPTRKTIPVQPKQRKISRVIGKRTREELWAEVEEIVRRKVSEEAQRRQRLEQPFPS